MQKIAYMQALDLVTKETLKGMHLSTVNVEIFALY